MRLPTELYDALEALAEREHYTRDAPELARTVRTALEHYLACPHRRQTGSVPHTSLSNNWQTENYLETIEDYTRQTIIAPEPREDARGQTEIVPDKASSTQFPHDKNTGIQAQPAVPETAPTFDAETFYLGELCASAPERHQYATTGKSVRYRKDDVCRGCAVAEKQTRQRTKASAAGQAAPAPRGRAKKTAKTATV